MFLSRIAVAAALTAVCLAAGAASPKAPKQVPRKPVETLQPMVQAPASVENRADDTGSWAELYAVPEAGLAGMVAELIAKTKDPKAAVAFITDQGLSVRLAGRVHTLEPVGFDITRAGAPVDYDEECKTVPRPGDRIDAVFSSKDKRIQASVNGTVVEHYPLGYPTELSQEAVRLDLSQPGMCDRVALSRLFVKASVKVSRAGKALAPETVLMQLITEH